MIVFKGVDANYEWENLNTFLVEGRFPNLGEKVSNEVVVSKVIAQRLSLEIGDDVSAYFQNSLTRNSPILENLKLLVSSCLDFQILIKLSFWVT